MLAHHALAVLPFVTLACCGPLIGRNPQLCNVGATASCCESVQSAGTPQVSDLLALLNVLPLLGNDQVGFSCTSLTGAGSTVKCGSNPVCCNQTQFNGLINVGCSPIDL
ncbi:fungal hydrophobin [Boletus reticuloceps]|uniref:Hydrophobin n=1 Tax=Boletus reticuloceps TaxID=495285 RepID=A0A8I2Z0C8_9AGAM|nr:fungal hydrophobin [Boletus reticuloceps]